MISLDAITQVENRYVAAASRPTLGEAFEMLLTRWKQGARDRETALRIAFLAWYSCSEPVCFTGLPGGVRPGPMFKEAFEALGGEDAEDAEVCFVVGLMAELFPWCLGDEAHWVAVGGRLSARARELAPRGVPAEQFDGRGAYGAYFAHMLASR